MRIAMAQVNATVGDLDGNAELVSKYIELAREARCQLVAFPELVITGYPPQDLLYERKFVLKNKQLVFDIIKQATGISGIIGFANPESEVLYNSAAVFSDGKLLRIVNKTLLPTYDVFDEDRYFRPGVNTETVKLVQDGNSLSLGTEICEDIWDQSYDVKVTSNLARNGADLIININASPYHVGKRFEREKIIREKATRFGIPIFYVNMVGGQDELVFDGQSIAIDKEGKMLALGRAFEEELVVCDVDLKSGVSETFTPPPYEKDAEIFGALVLGVRDYMRKTGFKNAVIGLSGGIDSSLTAVIATEALGRKNVLGVSLPSQYSSSHSLEDAKQLADNLGIEYRVIHIQEIFENYKRVFSEQFKGLPADITEENAQARIRGNVLMAISNKLGHLVLSTGNKTELALGYCTLYGDLSGGLAVIGDVSKSEVYSLARWYNSNKAREVIPKRCFEKIPSAELRPDQYDPFDYNIVSPLVDEIIEDRRSVEELASMGYDANLVREVLSMINRAEYKRWQAPPAIRITGKAFGIGRKMPIVNKFSG